jgi:hypothetical protein
MAEVAQSISIGTNTPVVAAEPPQQVSPGQNHPNTRAASATHKPPTKRQHRELLALAALGATFGFLTGWGLWTEIHFDSVEFVLTVVVLALAGYVFIDPLSELVKESGAEEGGDHGTERRGVAAGVFGAAGLLTVAAIDHSLTSALGEALKKLAEELGSPNKDLKVLQVIAPDITWAADWILHIGAFWTALILLGIVGFSSLAITYFWSRGARRQPILSPHFGAAVGLLLGIGGSSLLVLYLVRRDLFHSWPSWMFALLALFWFAVPGFMGGWAIRKLEDKPNPTREIAWYLVISSAVYIFAVVASARIIQHAFPAYKESIEGLIWLPVCALVFQNLGWGLVPYFRRKNCDAPLRPLGKVMEQPAPETAGPALLEMPRRDGAVLPVIATGSRQAPQEMILKPKRDRLLATVGLVLAVMVATPLYLLGTLRNDRSIAHSVEGNLQQDSGLRTKTLTVHSSGRVIMISGVVHNETERAEAIRRALSVRGVRQLIDQIQVVPPPLAPQAPPAASPGIVAAPEVVAPPSSINATVSIGGAAGPGPASSAASVQKSPAGTKITNLQKPATVRQPEVSKAADSEKHKGLLGLLKKGKQNLGGNPTDTHKSEAAKPNESSKPADAQKHGLFHFLKKDKNKENNNIKSGKNGPNNKSTKDPTTH